MLICIGDGIRDSLMNNSVMDILLNRDTSEIITARRCDKGRTVDNVRACINDAWMKRPRHRSNPQHIMDALIPYSLYSREDIVHRQQKIFFSGKVSISSLKKRICPAFTNSSYLTMTEFTSQNICLFTTLLHISCIVFLRCFTGLVCCF